MTHKQAVLRLLSDHKPHSHHELYALGCVAHSRISDLRRDGHRIEQWRENDLYLYRLLSTGVLNESAEPSPAPDQRGANTQLLAPADSLSTPLSNLGPDPHAAGAPHDDGRDGSGVLTLFPTPQVGAYGDAA